MINLLRSAKRRATHWLRPRTVVLMYHRVANLSPDPWQLAVSPENFAAQVALLKRKYRVVTIDELAAQLQKGKMSPRQVCLTFDDGYRDNYTAALPVLEKYDCPATFFVSTQFVQTGQSYWWDELQELILQNPHLPSPFSFSINGHLTNLALGDDQYLTAEHTAKQADWVWWQEPPTQRCRLYFELWKQLQTLRQAEIEGHMARLKSYLGLASVDVGDAVPMTVEDLAAMSRSRVAKIGLHTHTHPVLAAHDAAVQKAELTTNKTILEGICGYAPNSLSYPHGKFNQDTLSLLPDLSVTTAFTTTGSPVAPSSPKEQMSRCQVLNWNSGGLDWFLTTTLLANE